MNYVIEAKDWKLLIDSFKHPLNPDKIIAKPFPKLEIPFDNEIHEILCELDTIKSDVVHDAKIKGRKVKAGPQWGLADYKRMSDGTLELHLKPVTYYDALQDWGVAQNPELKKKVLEVSERKLGDTFALYGRVLAANTSIQLLREGIQNSYLHEIENGKELPNDCYGPYLVTFRGADQFDYWLAFHYVGGHPKKGDKAESEVVHDWHRVIASQVAKEIGVGLKYILNPRLRGLAENKHTHKPDLLYEIRINKTPSELFKLEDGTEREELLGLALMNDLDEFKNFVEKNQIKGKIYHPKDTSPVFRYVVKSVISLKGGFDPTTSTNFCPVGEANMALLLQSKGYDMTKIYAE